MVGKEKDITKDWLRSVDLSKTNYIIKIADLGFSRVLKEPSEVCLTYCGTPINMAPEVLNRVSYNFKADVWSLGTVLYELLVGESPFKDSKTKTDLKFNHRNFIFTNTK
jgi:serine/threonine protein kinase